MAKTPTIPQSIAVFHWPEFQALARRLGINTTASTTRLLICLDIEQDKPVRIDHNYIGHDEGRCENAQSCLPGYWYQRSA